EPTARPTPALDPLRSVSSSGTVTSTYLVQQGDTLGGIAAAIGATVADLQRINGMGSSTDLRAGQTIKIRLPIKDHAPSIKLIPDSELVNSPTAAQFDVAKFMSGHNGYLNRYSEKFDSVGDVRREIVERVAQQLSVHPRLLLALLEYEGGWVDNPYPGGDALRYPLGVRTSDRRTFSRQLSWAGARLNEGYYGWRLATRLFVTLGDGGRAYMGDGINAGTAGLQNYLAAVSTHATYMQAMGDDARGFIQTYKRLFGDPWQYDLGQLVPDGLEQPQMALPWAKGETWLITGGPHAAYGVGSPWAAIDFTPSGSSGCMSLPQFVTALAPGVIARSVNGEVVEAMDPSGDERIGWSIFYMHIGTPDRARVGDRVIAGSPIGHPSCEGGESSGSHLHLARKYNGEWLPAGGNIPFTMSGWVVSEGNQEYDGAIAHGGLVRMPCQCKDINTNGVAWQ
ncbi:MAG: LysM peptidoglycan-binding domain-containing protein, partial [Chloroflexi bacterium]|nr:LysM peptidoglycan-binding domain-containing protein [Chloroflexota bacterium]